MRARTPPVQHLLYGRYKLGLTRFKVDKGIIDALVHLRKKKAVGGRGEAPVGESVLATPLWGMLYADNAGVASQLPE